MPVPRIVEPSMKVTVPVGRPLVTGYTAAVSTTGPPNVVFAGAAPTDIVVAAFEMLTFTGLAELSDTPKLVLPVKYAAIESFPTASAVVFSTATPEAFRVAPPSTAVPLWNVTDPVGTTVPVAWTTVAVNATEVPYVAEVGLAVIEVVVPVVFTFTVTEPNAIAA